jgi:hypothetical protein
MRPGIRFLAGDLLTRWITVPTSLVKAIIDAVQKTTTQDEPKITEYDTLAGDGDCGETLLNGVNGERFQMPLSSCYKPLS